MGHSLCAHLGGVSSVFHPPPPQRNTNTRLTSVRMGALASVAVETKLVSECRQGGVCITSAEMHGARETMEDECIIHPSLNAEQHLVAVMDGHGGAGAARFVKQQLCAVLQAMPTPLTSSHVQLACMGVDVLLQAARPTERSGCTIAGVLLSKREALVFHAGDSRVVVFDTQTGDIIHETQDHKPTAPTERDRITSAGGRVLNERVDGNLAVARGMGDFRYKTRSDLAYTQQQVTAEAECTVVPMKPAYGILVFCDGVTERRSSNQPVVEAARRALSEGLSSDRAVCNLLDDAFASGSTDNMTAVLIRQDTAPAADVEMTQHVVDDDTVSERHAQGRTLPADWATAKRAFLDRCVSATNYQQVAAKFEQDVISPTPVRESSMLPHLQPPSPDHRSAASRLQNAIEGAEEKEERDSLSSSAGDKSDDTHCVKCGATHPADGDDAWHAAGNQTFCRACCVSMGGCWLDHLSA